MENSSNELDIEDSLNIAAKNWDRIIDAAKKVESVQCKITDINRINVKLQM